MKEKKHIKISIKNIIVISIIILILIISSVIYYINSNRCSEYRGDYQKVSYETNVGYDDEFDLKNLNSSKNEYIIIRDHPTYDEMLKNVKSSFSNVDGADINKFNNKFFINNSLLVVQCVGNLWLDTEILSFSEDESVANLKIYCDRPAAATGDFLGDIYFIPVSKKIKSAQIKFKYKTHKNRTTDDKPIIYLYPTKETEISVKLLKNENLICSYPKYKDKWNVLANNNGDLKDLSTNRQLYSLYYESENTIDFKVEKDGFIVKGENAVEFLEEKLDMLGLTEREAEEFIVYWLPKLEANKYNYIRFANLDEINENMPLEINPNPDTVIRVLMTFKGLENPINIEEQKLTTPERKGFTVVEWGGTEIE